MGELYASLVLLRPKAGCSKEVDGQKRNWHHLWLCRKGACQCNRHSFRVVAGGIQQSIFCLNHLLPDPSGCCFDPNRRTFHGGCLHSCGQFLAWPPTLHDPRSTSPFLASRNDGPNPRDQLRSYCYMPTVNISSIDRTDSSTGGSVPRAAR